MVEFNQVSATQFGEKKDLHPEPGECIPYETGDFIVNIYLEPPHVDSINKISGKTETYTPTKTKYEFTFNNDTLSTLSYLVAPSGRYDRSVTVKYSLSK